MHAGVGPGVCLLGPRTVPAPATMAYESPMESSILSTDVHHVPLPVAKLDEASVSRRSQWVERNQLEHASSRQAGWGGS